MRIRYAQLAFPTDVSTPGSMALTFIPAVLLRRRSEFLMLHSALLKQGNCRYATRERTLTAVSSSSTESEGGVEGTRVLALSQSNSAV
ncbi:hypothetical protein [Bradyrhizobium sp. 195]|uniref:hypothetical protein n=1 Tax=Bradyrhizobium sp. 195 TaxID=2782662 RepID=UPI0020018413|nr:hypothetical protein [Bradyrhizobium sp. 195]UPK28311.1 hypothetical protein IVB26_07705 [Bradyrhizobium sp. 195]